jgi:hypothetical protein
LPLKVIEPPRGQKQRFDIMHRTSLGLALITLADLGVSKKIASVAQQLVSLPSATREAIAQREGQ